MNHTQRLIVLFFSVAVGILSFSQKSQALDLREVTDFLLKRGICAALQMNVGECNPDNSQNPQKGDVPDKSNPDSQNLPKGDVPDKSNPDSQNPQKGDLSTHSK